MVGVRVESVGGVIIIVEISNVYIRETAAVVRSVGKVVVDVVG
jgi:hypothetical protein